MQVQTFDTANNPDSKVHGANMGPPGSCRPQMGPMLAPWTLLTGKTFPLLLNKGAAYTDNSSEFSVSVGIDSLGYDSA